MFTTSDRKQSKLLFATKWLRGRKRQSPKTLSFFSSVCIRYVRLCVANLQRKRRSVFFSGIRQGTSAIQNCLQIKSALCIVISKAPKTASDAPYDSALTICLRSNVLPKKSKFSSPLSILFIAAPMASNDEFFAALRVTNF